MVIYCSCRDRLTDEATHQHTRSDDVSDVKKKTIGKLERELCREIQMPEIIVAGDIQTPEIIVGGLTAAQERGRGMGRVESD